MMGNVVLGNVVEPLSVLSLPLAGKEVTATWPADRAGDERVAEENPIRGQLVNVGRLRYRMPRHAK